jgi:hypothetical protein
VGCQLGPHAQPVQYVVPFNLRQTTAVSHPGNISLMFSLVWYLINWHMNYLYNIKLLITI